MANIAFSRRLRRTIRLAVLFSVAAALLNGPFARVPGAQAGVVGKWTTLGYTMSINPVHIALLNNGKVLVVSGSGNVAAETNFRAAVWDPKAPASTAIEVQTVAWDMFCNGMVTLPDGRVLVIGGNLRYDPFYGETKTAAFDPATGRFTNMEPMAHGRWYPTATVLGDGRVMAFSGLNETGGTNLAVEIYTPGSGWGPEAVSPWTPPLYPRLHLMPNGSVAYSGSGRNARLFNPVTRTWSATLSTMNYGSSRTYGTSVLLPLSPADNYRARIMVFGGSNPSTATTEIIEPLAATPKWTYGPSMSQPRIEMNATILPNGKVLALGGSLNDEDTATASKNADLYDPDSNTFSSAGANAYARLYHSGSLLLPDGTVAVLGGNPSRGTYEARIEIYSPAYLFNSDGTNATRPTITGLSSSEVSLGSTFQVFTPNAASISSAVLIRPGAATHAFDMDQRLVKMNFTAGASVLDVTAPPNGNIAPPGWYMLFVLNSAGVPSVASWVHLNNAPANQAPSATITAPTGNVTVQAGNPLSFSGTGTDSDGSISSYSWSFPGGNPSSSSSANAGAVTYSTPGAYTASLRVTDDGGLTSAAATRTITVPDFTLAAGPSSQTVSPGGSAAYTTSVTYGAGLTGAVGLSVSGLPNGATAGFSPASLAGTGSSTLTVTTSTSTPAGSYPLTIKGTDGILTHTATVTLVVAGDFTISANPSSVSVARGGSTSLAVSITPVNGSAGTITLSAANLPKQTSANFAPSSLTSGTSTLTLGTKRQATRGTYQITIRGTNGSLTKTTSVTLVIQ